MVDGEFDHSGGDGGGSGSAAADAVVGAVVDNDWWQKRPAMRGLMVA